MNRFRFWQQWLLVVGLILSVFGILMALLSGTPLFSYLNLQIDPAFWSVTTVDESARSFQEWIYGVWGATIAGWGVFTAFIARYPFGNGEKWAWNCLATGVVVWFALDTALSVAHGVYFNAVFNLVVFLAFSLPLASSRRYFAH